MTSSHRPERKPALAAMLSCIILSLSSPVAADPTSPRASPRFDDIPYATWSDMEPAYRLYPGDELELSIRAAPELNKTMTVQPDGRIAPALLDPVMVADLTLKEAAATLSDAYAPHLLRSTVNLSLKTIAPLQIFVGGQVDKAGVYTMIGDMNALQAIMMAGGPRSSSRGEAIIIRRGPNGTAMMRRLDLGRALRDPAADSVPLRRLDIIYVPRSRISSLGEVVQQLRALLPFQFTYALSPTFRGY